MDLVISELGDESAFMAAGRQSFHSITVLREALEEVKEAATGDIYALVDGEGQSHRFTFAPWRDRDPDNTLLQITLRQNRNAARKRKADERPPKGPYEL